MCAALGSVWDRPDMVAGFAQSPPNERLMRYARQRRPSPSGTRVLDIGCGAGRNAVPLAAAGFDVVGIDRSAPMLAAAAARAAGYRMAVVEATMAGLPVRSRSIDFLVAHGIWNLARSDAEFRAAVAEAGRVAAADAALFLFTFSRHTLPPSADPIPGQQLVFTQFSGEPQVFLTREQLEREMSAAGFVPDPILPLRELNRPPPGQPRVGGAPVIFEAAFRFRGV